MADKQVQVPDYCVVLRERWNREPKEWRERLLQDLGVANQTLYRWMQFENEPDSKYKLTILEKHIPEISQALRRHFSAIFATSQDLILPTVAPVYARVHEALAGTDAGLILDAVTGIVLYALVNHLDIEQLGIVAFMGQLHSTPRPKLDDADADDDSDYNEQADYLLLNAWSAYGTGPWAEYPAKKSFIVGNNSIAALSVATGRAAFYPRDRSNLAPAMEVLFPEAVLSAASYPILRSGCVAGVVFVASTQLDYFTSYRRDIIVHYARMISLAFHDIDFYPRSQIKLHAAGELQSLCQGTL